MSTQARQIIADRRAEYFSDFTPEDPGEDLNVSGDTSSDGSEEVSSSSVLRKPSYVGLSHAVNGYTPYSQYKARLKKISPPLQIPVSPPSTLDSVGLVISQDSYHRSVSEFEAVMRDLSNMGRPQRNTDMLDCAAPSHRHLISNGDGYYPKTHSRQLIGEGETQSVEIVTKFHSDEDHSPTYNNSNNSSNSSRASPSKQQNLVQKQIERLYGDTHNHQVRMTSPEPDSVNQSPAEKTPERKISGGFFAKRFGIIKMKDHSSKKLVETSEGESSPGSDYKPLKVPAVFRLLRPEFREQLKQSSCKIEIPHEKNKQQQERIIPIRREGDTVENGESSSTTPERTVPIVTSQNGHHNNNNNKSPPSNSSERVIPIRRESGDINNTPKRPAGFAPKVNGFSNGQSKSVVNGSSNGHSDKAEVSSNGKQNIVRKLSPLSPKHIVVPSSAEKPAPMPKPDHLKSPPMSPEPASSPAVTPPLVTGDTPVVTEPVVPAPAVSQCPVPPTHDTSPSSASPEHDQCGVTSAQVTSVPTSHTTLLNNINNNHNNHSKPAEQQPLDESYEDYDNPEEYPEEFYYENPPVPSCGLRERELLCPIMEEDNESTASGSIMNLANTNNPVIGTSGYSPDDPLLISEQGEVQDGHYFIKVLENEIFKFEENICDFEEDLNSGADIPDEVKDTILTVIGMAKLLMAQKLTQFRELCCKNINVSRDEDPFVPTCQDLAGFWDMVSIQVDQIHDRFNKLVDLRKAGWVVKKPEVVKNNKTASKKTPASKTSKPKEKSEAAKARDEARKKMMEEKRRMMKEKQAKKQSGEDDTVIMIM